ncbi:MAG TPA: hypothetical protein VFM06_11350 [Candidatus Limnocylindria bacterium]|nr:hypothetical protein [Candidatus Limnocylindria bacterium]
MRAVWTIIRIGVVLVAVATLFVTILFVSGPAGTTIDTQGLLVDAIAVAALLFCAATLYRDRSRLF